MFKGDKGGITKESIVCKIKSSVFFLQKGESPFWCPNIIKTHTKIVVSKGKINYEILYIPEKYVV